MQTLQFLREQGLTNHLISFPLRFYCFYKWSGSTQNLSLNFALLWLPKVLLEKMNNKKKELNGKWWMKSLLLQTLIYPAIFVFFQCFKDQSSISNVLKQNGVLGLFKGVFTHLLYESLVLSGNWIKNDFNTKGLGHLTFLILQIPFLYFLEYQTAKSATEASLTNSFLSVICYLAAYIIENTFEFKTAWNIFGNSKFIGG